MVRLLINARETEKRIVAEENGQIKSLFIEQPEHKSLFGNIYLGIVEDIVPSMNAAFINIGKGKKGFLHVSQVPSYLLDTDDTKRQKPIQHFLHQGEKLIVQVQKDETEHKYYRVSGNIELAGEALIYMPYGKYVAVSRKLTEPVRQALKEIGQRIKEPSEGMILRTETEKLSETDLQSRLQKERERWQHLLKKSQSLKAPAPLFVMNHFLEEINAILMKMNVDEIVVDVKPLAQQLKERYGNRYPISFYREKENLISHYTLQKEWESLHKKVVWLKNGANIVIEESEAFTIIDINTAKFTASSEKEAAIRKTNMLAAQEIAKQIRLRNMGGNIFIDFINMKNEHDRNAIIQLLKKEFANDTERVTIYGFTALGVLEMSRKRTRPSLQQKLNIPCPVCSGSGAVPSPATIAFQLERELWAYKDQQYTKVIIEATEDVQAYFKGEYKAHTKQLEETLHFSISFQTLDHPIPHYHIKRFMTE